MQSRYIRSEKSSITIVTNKVASALDLQTMKKYVKNANQINMENVQAPHLSQSKSYLKIISLPYLMNNMNVPLNLEVVEKILKNNYIFNNISLASRPRIIKISPKSDMTIIWLDIWDLQSSSNAKGLINRYFNFRSFIAIICEVDKNSSVPQYKKCWKWGHSIQSCRVQGSKCVKCNGLHITEHHCQFSWCCKANPKTNPPRLETKQGNPCSHLFKCLNCKEDYQADLNLCSF